MKENITNIMNDLKVGQIIIASNNKPFVFIEPKRTRAIVLDKKTGKKYSIKGMVEVTQDLDQEIIDKLEEEAIEEFQLERKIKKMVRGQYFIGSNDEEYIYLKFNKTTLLCKNAKTGEEYRAKPKFVKTILQKMEQKNI